MLYSIFESGPLSSPIFLCSTPKRRTRISLRLFGVTCDEHKAQRTWSACLHPPVRAPALRGPSTRGSYDRSTAVVLINHLMKTGAPCVKVPGPHGSQSPSASSISQDQQAQQAPKAVIPTQRRVTEQLTRHWAPFLDNPKSAKYQASGSAVAGSSGNGYNNNRIFAASSDNQIALGAQNTAVGNAANQYKIGRYVDLTNTGGQNIYGATGLMTGLVY